MLPLSTDRMSTLNPMRNKSSIPEVVSHLHNRKWGRCCFSKMESILGAISAEAYTLWKLETVGGLSISLHVEVRAHWMNCRYTKDAPKIRGKNFASLNFEDDMWPTLWLFGKCHRWKA